MIRFGMVWRVCAVLSCVAVSGAAFLSTAQADTAAEFFAKDRALWSADVFKPTASTISRPAAGGRTSGAARVAGLRGSRAVFVNAARQHGVPVNVALATVMVESRGNCGAVGRAGELGPLQIKLQTARGLGYRGSAAGLRNCGAGLYWGMRHLALAYRKCGSAVLHQKGLYGSCSRTAYGAKVQRIASRI